MAVVQPLDANDVALRPHRYFRRKYTWEWPVRVYHWVNAVCISVLFLTGLYIATPILAPAGEAYGNLVTGKIRQLHFAFAFVFLVSFLFRMYWFWVGNNYARSGFPFVWRSSWWSDLARQAGDYLRFERGHVHLGHNALAGLAYTLFAIGLGWVQVFTGLALYSESNPGGFWDSLVGWVIPLLGGSFRVHMWHHLSAWGFIVFAILHIYIVVYDGQLFKNGLVSSMISGMKFYQDGDIDHDTWLS